MMAASSSVAAAFARAPARGGSPRDSSSRREPTRPHYAAASRSIRGAPIPRARTRASKLRSAARRDTAVRAVIATDVDREIERDARDADARGADAAPPNRVDFLVIGSGIAGLTYALEAAELGDVAIVTKDVAYMGSTHYAQGGISAVISLDDTVEEHVRDTQVAGDHLCDEDAVKVVCDEGKDAIEKLIEFGTKFTMNEQTGDLHLAREGGHSKHRIVHAADMTGKEIERALLESARAHPRVTFYEFHVATDLITAETRDGSFKCVGAEIIDRRSGARTSFISCATMLASGGAGQLFPSTTNPGVSTGDGVAMAVRARADVANMEFYQFHPTSLYTGPGGAAKRSENENAFLVTEAVRGHGGRLFNAAGERFMERYDERLELAPRDVVARAIDCEIKSAREAGYEAACVYLSVAHLPADDVLKNFPGIAAELAERGVDMTSDKIPVVPAAHYLCGGVSTDLNGQTSVEGLFACGETACTGVHGANRLASNSLLEAVVFANRAVKASGVRFAGRDALEPVFEQAAEAAKKRAALRMNAAKKDVDEIAAFDEPPEWTSAMRAEVQRVMWNAAGIVRDTETLKEATTKMASMLEECEEKSRGADARLASIELRNLLTVGLCTLRCAASRKESRGLHYNVDYPERVETERKPTRLDTASMWNAPSSVHPALGAR